MFLIGISEYLIHDWVIFQLAWFTGARFLPNPAMILDHSQWNHQKLAGPGSQFMVIIAHIAG